jgi:hypothetical protein
MTKLPQFVCAGVLGFVYARLLLFGNDSYLYESCELVNDRRMTLVSCIMCLTAFGSRHRYFYSTEPRSLCGLKTQEGLQHDVHHILLGLEMRCHLQPLPFLRSHTITIVLAIVLGGTNMNIGESKDGV